MKILLDCRFQKGAGPNVTASYLIDHIIKLNKEHELLILQHKGQSLPDYPGIKKILVPSRNPLFDFCWVQLILPRVLKHHGIDVCHSLKHVGPLFTSIPTILHLREVMHFLPDGQKAFQLNLLNKIYWNYILVLGLKRANHIIGVSQECRKVIVQKFNIPKQKISTVYQGLDPKFKTVADSDAMMKIRKKYNLPESYILCVSNFYPHKNFQTVVKMFAKLKDVYRKPLQLVMVGDTSYASADFFGLIKKLGLKDDITFTEFVEHDDLVLIYNGANLFLFPPLVASFPNPCLEAMACGIPVIASNLGAIAEVLDGAALLLENPSDDDEMLQATCKLLEDRALRENFKQRGFQRAKEFTWEASASNVLQLYEAIGKRQPLRRRPA